MMVKGVRIGTHSESWWEKVPGSRSCDGETLLAPNEVRTNGTESRLIFHDLQERVDDEHAELNV